MPVDTDRLRVGGFTAFSSIDYPGQLAAVVFCQGCPWRCRYCHNAALLDPRGSELCAWDDIEQLLQRRRGLLDAVVFSGGEPTAQHGLGSAMRRVRELGFKVGLHTGGAYPRRLGELLPLLDWIGLDIKALPDDYPALTGVADSGARAWDSLQQVIAAQVAHEVRITVHEQLLAPEQLTELVQRIHRAGSEQVVLQHCRAEYALDPSLGPSRQSWAGESRQAWPA